jgi:hypothetical protein
MTKGAYIVVLELKAPLLLEIALSGSALPKELGAVRFGNPLVEA